MALDDYKPLGFYETNLGNIQEGFAKFSAEGEHYFTYNVGNQIYLISEGYASEAARDNGINSVTNNMGNEERYKYDVDDNGNHFFSLRAGNNQEIATSRWFDTAGAAQTGAARLRGGDAVAFTGDIVAAGGVASIDIAAPTPLAGPPKPKKKRKKRTTPKKPKAERVYLQEGSYPINNVTYKIFRSGNLKHYFTFHREDGKTLFLNSDVRGFATEQEAKDTVDQVMIYGPVEANYEGKQTRNGKYYFYLKGAEGKNIGKSFFYGTTEDMQAAVGLMLGASTATANTNTDSADALALKEKAAAEEAEKARLAAEAAKAKAEAEAKAKADNEAKAAAAAAAAAASVKRSGLDEYLHCREYQGKGRSSDNKDFSTFAKDGSYYFALLDSDDKVRLRSQGYTSEAGRDNGIASVIKNRTLKERWSTDEENGKYFSILKAGNSQEIGRSCPYNDKASAGWIWGAAPAAAAAASVKRSGLDEYLHCREYQGKGRSSDNKDFSTFAKDGSYYFALLDSDDKVRLRSQGYTSEAGRDNGIASVIKNRKLKERWSTGEEDGKYFSILKAGNSQEIGRSCPYNDKASAGWIWGAAPAAAVASAAAVAPKITAQKAEKKKKVVAAAPVKAAAATTAAASTGGGMKWLWWLLPLLLLLLLLWFLLRGCGGCNTAAPIAAPVVEEVIETVVPIDTIDQEAERLAAEQQAREEEEARVQAAAAEKEARRRALEEEMRRGGNKSSGF